MTSKQSACLLVIPFPETEKIILQRLRRITSQATLLANERIRPQSDFSN